MRNIFLLLVVALITTTTQAQYETYKMNWQKIAGENQYNPEAVWLQDAKFGIYFHWGVYSVPAFSYEWYPRHMFMETRKEYHFHKEKYGDPKESGYETLVPLFKAEHFNAREWVELFHKAGARFAGPVAEHHDGFAMWDSKITPWNASLMGPHRDILGEIEKEIRDHGMKLVTTFHHARNFQRYHNDPKRNEKVDFWDQWDSHYPYIEGMPTLSDNPMLRLLYGNVTAEEFYNPIWFGKLKEVIDNYSPDVIWFDAWLDLIPEEYLYKFVEYYVKESKKQGRDVVICRKQGDLPLSVSIENLEKSRKQNIEPRLWMTDETISTDSWSYTEDMELKTAKDLIDVLIDVVSKNGVLLLNVSPRADGVIPSEQREILLSIGEWLNVNGEGIYGTRPWYTYGQEPTTQPEGSFDNHKEFLKVKYSPKDVRYTKKGNTIYAMTLGVPAAGEVMTLEAFAKHNLPAPLSVKQVSVLGTNQPVKWSETQEGLSIEIPIINGDKAVSFRIECE
ncbi:MAG: alpha-L-fucosidase [Tannerellaceae bacterium]|nr:alpha-L-fucosidase [Tannerellaceae bacterium]